jgi:threonine/homoserine/homoserine lactone efflux protein
MMPLHSYLLFVLAAFALILVPGPDRMRVSRGLRRNGSITVWLLRRGLGVLFIGLGLRIAVERV